MQLATPDADVLGSGERTGCQVALTQLHTEVEEVSYRIESAEPTVDHLVSGADPDPDRRPAE